MKKLILLELALLFLATTFSSTPPPPGWYQQTLPVNKEITDIYFADSLNGWAITSVVPQNIDTIGYILHTTNGGENWNIQFQGRYDFVKIQFINKDTGFVYAIFGFGYFFRTTDGGLNWTIINNNLPIYGGNDMFFITRNTGWICSNFPDIGGLAKTTNGGENWSIQLNESFRPSKIFFINADTGWLVGNAFNVFKSFNGGNNWNLLNNFGNNGVADIFFISRDTGFLSGGGGSSAIKKTINGGVNWFATNKSIGGRDIYFINSKIGWICDIFSTIQKTTDSGLNWFNQSVPQGYYNSIQFVDSLNGWSGGTKMIKTTDGGGPTSGIVNENTIPDKFIFFQNYPNPFNPYTVISYTLRIASYVVLKVYDIQGKEIKTIVNQRQNAGEYKIEFEGSDLPSGVYFYRLETNSYSDTKRMILLK